MSVANTGLPTEAASTYDGRADIRMFRRRRRRRQCLLKVRHGVPSDFGLEANAKVTDVFTRPCLIIEENLS